MSSHSIFKSSIGKKAIVSVTGILLLGFLVAHMLGNLQVFLGPEAINAYAKKLKSMPEILFLMRGGLLTVFVLHVVTAIILSHQNRKARPIRYKHEATVQASYASRLMVVSGILILLYVIYHLGHFTLGRVHSEYFHYKDAAGNHDVYRMIVESFKNPTIAITYIIAMAALCFHLFQAAAVFPQSLGLVDDVKLKLWRKVGVGVAHIIFVGYAIIPLSVLLGWVK